VTQLTLAGSHDDYVAIRIHQATMVKMERYKASSNGMIARETLYGVHRGLTHEYQINPAIHSVYCASGGVGNW
jgi:hypothetical protein